MAIININDIRIDGGTQGRYVINQGVVSDYAEAMKSGAVFPALETVFDGSTHWLVDGFHRFLAYKIVGTKQVTANVTDGSQLEAQVMSFGMNAKHGLQRTNEDKRRVVELAIEHPLTKDKTNKDIALLCHVSASFVAAVRNPEVAERQNETRNRHIKKKAEQLKSDSPTIDEASDSPTTGAPADNGADPDSKELHALEAAHQADIEAMGKLLESDEALKTAYDEIKRLNELNAVLEARNRGLMNERNEAVKLVKKLQKQVEELRKK